MNLSLATVMSLLVGLAGLLAAHVTGFLQAHPDITTVLVGVEQILSAFLPGMLKPPADK